MKKFITIMMSIIMSNLIYAQVSILELQGAWQTLNSDYRGELKIENAKAHIEYVKTYDISSQDRISFKGEGIVAVENGKVILSFNNGEKRMTFAIIRSAPNKAVTSLLEEILFT